MQTHRGMLIQKESGLRSVNVINLVVNKNQFLGNCSSRSLFVSYRKIETETPVENS